MRSCKAVAAAWFAALALVMGCAEKPPREEAPGTGAPPAAPGVGVEPGAKPGEAVPSAKPGTGGVPAAGPAARPAPPVSGPAFEALLPEGTLVYVAVEGAGRMREELSKTAVAAIAREPEVKAFLERPLKAVGLAIGQAEEELGVKWDDALKAFGGRVALALTRLELAAGSPDAAGVLMADVTDAPAARQIVEALAARLVRESAGDLKRTDSQSGGFRLVSLREETPGGVEIVLALSDDLLLAGASPAPNGAVQEVIAARARPPMRSLATAYEYSLVSGKLGKGRLCTWFADSGAILDKVLAAARREDPAGEATARRVLDALGLLGVKSAGFSMSVDAPGLTQRMFIRAPAPRKGLPALIGDRAVESRAIRVAGPSAASFAAARVNLSSLYDLALTTLRAGSPETASQVTGFFAQLRQQTGVDLENDLLRGFGDEIVAVADSSGLAGPEAAQAGAVAISLKDPAKFAPAFEVVMAMGSAALMAMGVQLQVVTVDGASFRKFQIPNVAAAPLVGVAGERLVVAGGDEALRRLTRALQSAPGRRLADTKEFADLLSLVTAGSGSPGSAVSYCDTAQLADGVADAIRVLWNQYGAALGGGAGDDLAACSVNLQQLALALQMYAMDKGGAYPRRLEDLRGTDYIADPSILSCPRIGTGVGYVYVSGVRAGDPDHWIVAYDLPSSHEGGKLNVARVSGAVEQMSAADVNAAVARQKAEGQARGRALAVVSPPVPARAPAAAVTVVEGEPDLDDPSTWFDLTKVPTTAPIKKHLFAALSVVTTDNDGIMETAYGPMASLGTANSGVFLAGVGIGAAIAVPGAVGARRSRPALPPGLPRGGIEGFPVPDFEPPSPRPRLGPVPPDRF
jgi:hypothetical protein